MLDYEALEVQILLVTLSERFLRVKDSVHPHKILNRTESYLDQCETEWFHKGRIDENSLQETKPP